MEALEFLRADSGARPLAGGTDLLLDLARSAADNPQTLVDLSAIAGLAEIADFDDAFVIGAGVTHAEIVADSRLTVSALPLAQACLEIGSPQLRNRATVAGNIASASPANDTISALMALDADIELVSLGHGDEIETRAIPISQFFPAFRQTVIEPGELIRAIRVPKLQTGARGIWMKAGLRKNQAISVVHGAIVVDLDGEQVANARLALGSVGPTVALVAEFGESLVGSSLSRDSIEAAASIAAASIEPISDGRGSADYRRSIVKTLVRRGLSALADRTEAVMWPANPPTLSTPGAVRPAPRNDVVTDDTTVEVRVNNAQVFAPSAASQTLLDWLRSTAGAAAERSLSGVKEGCAEGECGACTVVLNGSAVMSCLVSAAQVDGGSVVTVEGIGASKELHAVQEAFIDEFAVQCGYCIPGFIVAAARLLDEYPDPSNEQIEHALSGNLCRCTGYYPMFEAIREAARARRDGRSS